MLVNTPSTSARVSPASSSAARTMRASMRPEGPVDHPRRGDLVGHSHDGCGPSQRMAGHQGVSSRVAVTSVILQDVRARAYCRAMADQVTAPTLDPFAPGFFENPYAQYAAIRDAGRVHRTLFGPWMLTHWEHVHQLLRDPTTSVEDRNAPESQFSDLFEPPDLGRTPEETGARRQGHPQHRPARPHAAAQARVEGVHPADRRAAPAAGRGAGGRPARPGRRGRGRRPDGRWDVISGLAFPLPFAVISEMLGMPDSTDTRAAPRVVPHARPGARPDPRGDQRRGDLRGRRTT